jgi:uncharacterized delta-60 repeat protein
MAMWRNLQLALVVPASCAVTAVAAADFGLDTSFGDNGIVRVGDEHTDSAGLLLVQPNGRITTCAVDHDSSGHTTATLYRFDVDGAPDAAFGAGGHITLPSNDRNAQCRALTMQADGRVVVATTGISPVTHDIETQVFRVDDDGTPDASFGESGVAHVDIQIDAAEFVVTMLVHDDDILVCAPLGFSVAVERLDANGAHDSTFGVGGRQAIPLAQFGSSEVINGCGMAIDASGRVVVSGSLAAETVNVANLSATARVLVDGTPDTSFGANSISTFGVPDHSTQVFPILPDSAGRLIEFGFVATGAGIAFSNEALAVARLGSDGTPDASFGSGGISVLRIHATDLFDVARYGVIESDGKLLVIGSAQHADGSAHGVFLQLDADGQPDPNFGVGGVVELSLTSDGLGFTGISAVARQGAGLVFSANVLEPADAYFHQYLVRAASDSVSAPPAARGHSHHRRAAP